MLPMRGSAPVCVLCPWCWRARFPSAAAGYIPALPRGCSAAKTWLISLTSVENMLSKGRNYNASQKQVGRGRQDNLHCANSPVFFPRGTRRHISCLLVSPAKTLADWLWTPILHSFLIRPQTQITVLLLITFCSFLSSSVLINALSVWHFFPFCQSGHQGQISPYYISPFSE